ncbi:hypothetical protein M405DRAFT_871522 [Rhizopogon salebrosus TDB-379]|nr:hypothetical protein M405DRAFT_871522 [Rhizopogon salebrosus TDB-379]
MHYHTGKRTLEEGEVYRPDILAVVDVTIDSLSTDLRVLSLDIHDHPEIKFEERYAHDAYTSFLEKCGFEVTRHHFLETAWVATYTHGKGGRVLGVNSEMDALPGIGHACGHNLIGIAGVVVACAAKAAMELLNIDGKVVLLGTPAEEGGYGKVKLWEKGAYKEMDVCLMCHPGPGPLHSFSLSNYLAVIRLEIEYKGYAAHAASSPWEGRNALDASVLAYANISLLRQQIKPTHRVHGIIEGHDWAPNIIPDNSKMYYYIRAPTTAEAEETLKRVVPCFEAAALATGTTVKVTREHTGNELVQNEVLGDELSNVIRKKYGYIDYVYGTATVSTDFGNISYRMPGLHPDFSIPTVPGGGNHTPAFTKSARSQAAHDATLTVSKALACVGMRVITDGEFLQQVKDAFEEQMKNKA